jgi:hypothetical protein
MATIPTPWPGAYAEPTVITDQVAQGVISGDTSARLNEIAQVQKGLVWFNPQVAPLLRLVTRLKNPRSVENTRFFHLEKQRLPREAAGDAAAFVQAGSADTPTQLLIDDTSRFRVYDLLYNVRSGDVSQVTSIDSGTLISVLANIGDAAPAGGLYANSDTLVNIGNAYLDGSGSGSPLHIVEDEKLFYTQIFKDATDESDRYQKTALYEGDPWTNARKQCEQEHLLSCEHAMFFGKPDIKRDPTTGKWTTYMGGLRHYADVNVVDFGGDDSITKEFFDAIMVEAMREGHSGFENKEMATKTFFGSHRWCAALNQLADASIRTIDPSEKTYGLRIMQYQGSWGVLNIINAPVLNRGNLAQYGWVLDMEHLRPANFKGRDTSWKDNIQENDADSRKGQYISDKSFIVEITPSHTRFENLAASDGQP